MKTVLQLDGLDCAVCAAELEEQISKIDGVIAASLAFTTQKLSVECDGEETLEKVIYTANHFEEVRVIIPNEKNAQNTYEERHMDGELDENASKKRRAEWLRIALSAVCFVCGAVCGLFASKLVALEILSYVFFGIAYLVVAYPILILTGKNVAKGKIFDENFLMTVASIGAMLLGEIAEGVAVMLLYQLGETLQVFHGHS